MKDVNSINAKSIKWAGAILGIAFLLLGAMSFFLKVEDEEVKESVIRFATLGLLGLLAIVLAAGMEATLYALSRIEERTSDKSEDDETDILA